MARESGGFYVEAKVLQAPFPVVVCNENYFPIISELDVYQLPAILGTTLKDEKAIIKNKV